MRVGSDYLIRKRYNKYNSVPMLSVVVAVDFEFLIDRSMNLREQPRLVYLKIDKQVDDSWTIGRCFVR